MDKLHSDKISSETGKLAAESSMTNLNRFVAELKDQNNALEKKFHQLEKENIELVHKDSNSKAEYAVLLKSMQELGEKNVALQKKVIGSDEDASSIQYS